ncbi:hypothetical protein ZYGR_0AU00100 [Zygosaccharomyces rouxii]|uniref:Aminotransferase class I/classII large domain-containing protein n=1 Tax=Zygosaccharomyces rouxii TaxID=4956 RepID=A0A1Q3AI20_ZYGRO|nr:hypothetical protein ZYGR_0AU00100 [Zygosaccharomyces rouxii]
MPHQEDFGVEQFMNEYETGIAHNMAETCCYSLSLNEVCKISGEKFNIDLNTRLTYGAIEGSDVLRTLIASSYGEEFTKENVLVTNGAIAANFLLYYALVNPGDHVISVAPTYSQLSSVPSMFGADVELIHLKEEEDFNINVESLKSMVKPNTKLLILNNPNNPLGKLMSTETLSEISALCNENGIYLHCDEVYRPLFHSLPLDMSPAESICRVYENGISTGSMSKAYSAAGIRVGWIVSKNLDVLKTALSRRDYNTISVSKIDDMIAQYLLRNRESVLKRNYLLCQKNLKVLNDFIKSNSDKFAFVTTPQAGCVCLVRPIGINNTEKFARYLAEEWKTLALPGELFGIPNALRIGYGNSEEDLLTGLPILKNAYDKWMSQ